MTTLPSSLNSGRVKAPASLTASLMALIPVLMFFPITFLVADEILTNYPSVCSRKFFLRRPAVLPPALMAASPFFPPRHSPRPSSHGGRGRAVPPRHAG